jgi:hypothetical protein
MKLYILRCPLTTIKNNYHICYMDTDNKFIRIQEYYDKINRNLQNMVEDIVKLDNTHKYYFK